MQTHVETTRPPARQRKAVAKSAPKAAYGMGGVHSQIRKPIEREDFDAIVASHEADVVRLAGDIQDIMGRSGSVKDDDLVQLGWSLPKLAELTPDALARVHLNDTRRIDRIC